MKRLLIANRGEIAARIIKTCRAMGIETVAVYSDADRDAPHVTLANASVRLGPGPAGESYLCADAVLEAAKNHGADAVHPGYGFLSENAGFADACAKGNITFVGPSSAMIRALGDKIGAKRTMAAAGVPVVPGYNGDDQADDVLQAEARKIGTPLLIKASAGVAHSDLLNHKGSDYRRDNSKPDLGEAELCLWLGSSEVTDGNQARATAQRGSMSLGDGDFWARVHRFKEHSRSTCVGEILVVGVARHAAHPVEVGPCAEALARAREHDHPHGIVARKHLENLGQLGD
jgi:hypothetical protein